MYNDIYMKGVILENRNKGFRAGGIVIKDGKILLMRQFLGPRDGKREEDFYTLPGGSWEAGETIEQTCKREIKEEFNLDVTVGRLLFLIDTESRIAFYFECTTDDIEIALGGPEKERMHANEQYHVEWVNLSKIKELTFIPTPAKEAVLKHLEQPNQPAFFFSTNK
ncbi:MAG: MutT/nudix family protein [candidate division WWE3 bacterium GW2011_GWA1_43_94]|nr:MAG: MutT/nudix family protein [candidate division WWE3 bacterium GW2011_GWA1_43_94]